MGLIIPAVRLEQVLPSDAANNLDAITDAVTEASAFVDTWTSKHYEPWDAYTEASATEEITYGAPREIVYACTQVAKHMFYLNTGSITRDGAEDVDHEERIEYYRKMLEKIDIKPTSHTATVSLDSEGYQLIAQNKNILTHKAKIASGSTNVWNLGSHFFIVKGSTIDIEDYLVDAWYLDGSSYASTLEGTLTYWRSYRNDGKDYMMTYLNGIGYTSG